MLVYDEILMMKVADDFGDQNNIKRMMCGVSMLN